MYGTAKSARNALKSKARRMAAGSGEKVDSSNWTPAEPLNTTAKTGMRPVSRRAFKAGGKVVAKDESAANPARADKVSRNAKQFANAKVNRNVKDANEERPGIKHVGGLKTGGRAGKKKGGPVDYSVTGKDTVTVDERPIPMPTRRPAEFTSSKTPDYDTGSRTGAGAVTEDRKRGGRTGKMFGGVMAGDERANMVSPDRFKFTGAPGLARKTGGKADKWEGSAKDEAQDKKLAKKHGMSMKKWEASMMDKKHDIQHSTKGLKSGGKAEKWIQGAIKKPGALHKALGVPKGEKIPEKKLEKAEHSSNPKLAKRARLAETLKRFNRATGGGTFSGSGYPGKVPGVVGGRIAKALGGETEPKKAAKGKTDITINIASGPKPGDMLPGMPPKGAPPSLPMPAGMPPGMPMGMPPGPPPGAMMGPPPGMPPAGAGGPPPKLPPEMMMGRKAGGRVYHSYKDMDAGSGSGLGRLEKTEIQAHKPRKSGGRTYRSYKDMDAGAGSGKGRLEKTEIQSHK